MSEKPLDRLNYYNGKRLVASDLKLEQEYHIRVRRWLNKSLYSPGIARGLEVRHEAGTLDVVVGPGLAIDADGREIILLDEVRVPVRGKGGSGPCGKGTDRGSYLTIQYDEAVTAEESDGCCPPAGTGTTRGGVAAWGGPARVRATPLIRWTDVLPTAGSGEILLARVTLDAGCTTVQVVDASVRRYVGAGSAATVRQYALEGEREVARIPAAAFPAPQPPRDVEQVGRIVFHIRARQPSAVTLYLRAEEFRVLQYTELGEHAHSASVSGWTEYASPPLTTTDTAHRHGASDTGGGLTAAADPSAGHTHALTARRGYIGTGPNQNRAGFVLQEDGYPPAGGVPVQPELILNDVNGTIDGGEQHSHPVTGTTAAHTGFAYDHRHQLGSIGGGTGSTGASDAGQPGKKARTGAPLGYVWGLEVWIGQAGQTPVNYTADILRQLADTRPATWGPNAVLGDGTAGHVLATQGTGPVRLDFLPQLAFTEGEYAIELRAPARKNALGNDVANGGRVLYNLYVE